MGQADQEVDLFAAAGSDVGGYCGKGAGSEVLRGDGGVEGFVGGCLAHCSDCFRVINPLDVRGLVMEGGGAQRFCGMMLRVTPR
jgi:hypothetical protein